jgi:hypothetical protein
MSQDVPPQPSALPAVRGVADPRERGVTSQGLDRPEQDREGLFAASDGVFESVDLLWPRR